MNLLTVLLSFIVHVVCRVNKKFGNTKKSVNLFPNHKRQKYICMKYICITKYIHTLFRHKYIHKKFLDNKTYNWLLVKTVVKL